MDNRCPHCKPFRLSELDCGTLRDNSKLLQSEHLPDGRWNSSALTLGQLKNYMTADIQPKLDKIISILETIAKAVTSSGSKEKMMQIVEDTPSYKLADGADLKMLVQLLYKIAHAE